MKFTVRRATKDDMAPMQGLWREMMDFQARVEPRFRPNSSPAGEEAWAKHMLEDAFENTDWCVFVAEAAGPDGAGSVVGYITGLLRTRYPVFEPELYGYVTDIVVAPEARRSGVGRALFEALKAWAREHGATHLELQVTYHNPTSQAFWRAQGCTDFMDTLWYDLAAE